MIELSKDFGTADVAAIPTANRRMLGWLTISLLSVASLFLLYAAHQHRGLLNDDSYIGLKYARNLADGKGFVYNDGLATLGTTTPLLILTIAGLGSVLPGVEFDTIAVFLSIFCWIGTLWTFYLFRETWGLEDWQAGILGIVLASSVWMSALGMEAYLFSFLLVMCLSLFFQGHHWWAGLAAGLLFLTRGEGVLVLFLLMALGTIRDWINRRSLDLRVLKPALLLGLGFAVPFLIWFVYAELTFGTFLPNTLAAKQAQKQTHLWRTFFQALIEIWMPVWGKTFTIAQLPSRTLWWLLIGIGAISSLCRRRQWLAFLAWIAMYVTGYSLLGVAAYAWYQLPMLFVLQLFLALGIIECIDLLLRWVKPSGVSIGLSTAFALVVLLNLVVLAIPRNMSHQGDHRGKSYSELCKWFRDNTAAHESVGYIEVGYLGYYTVNPIIDLTGLVLPDIVPHVAKGDFAWGFWHYAPDYYVYTTDFDWALKGIKTDPKFERSYARVATLPGPRQADLVIYKRIVR
jgi:hypothetical protein